MPNVQPARTGAYQSPREAISAFVALLEREQQALTQADADALEAIAGEKQTLARAIHALGTPTAAALKADAELHRMVQHAQHLNNTNAKLIALHRNFCDSRLQLLRGSESSNVLYRANGHVGH